MRRLGNNVLIVDVLLGQINLLMLDSWQIYQKQSKTFSRLEKLLEVGGKKCVKNTKLLSLTTATRARSLSVVIVPCLEMLTNHTSLRGSKTSTIDMLNILEGKLPGLGDVLEI